MISNENKMLVKYIFPSIECLEFFKEQLFEELKEVVPETLCYSKTNQNVRTRFFNKNECMNLIREFFINNEVYKNEVERIYKEKIDELIDSILLGYVFLLKSGKNIIEDNNSVCYTEGVVFKDLT